jgi:hypothetical protein
MSSVRDHLPAGSVVSIIGKVSAEPMVNLIQSKLVFPRLLYGLENKSKKERVGGGGGREYKQYTTEKSSFSLL